jgi:molybdenum cofactor cytidylyltransferase
MRGEKNLATNIGVILLAAGSSSRLGTPKQLLQYEDETLLQHSLQVARASNVNPIVVVLGAKAELIMSRIDVGSSIVIINDKWQEGMASSIRCGINSLLKESPGIEGAILMVCDQPFIYPDLLLQLITKQQLTGKPIITSSYADTFGPPTLFHKTIFSELLQLKGDVGAKSILRLHASELEFISFPEGVIDIDTDADYQKLSK